MEAKYHYENRIWAVAFSWLKYYKITHTEPTGGLVGRLIKLIKQKNGKTFRSLIPHLLQRVENNFKKYVIETKRWKTNLAY